jgi:hypothetical protein
MDESEPAMKERPILFSAPMVRALLDGTKTQTRRVCKWRDLAAGLNLGFSGLSVQHMPGGWVLESPSRTSSEWRCSPTPCPYGQPGDRLWVRETTVRVEDHGYSGPVYVESDEGRACLTGGLAPSEDDCTEVEPYDIRRRPAIHMPRSMSRIDLEVTGVRVERLQEISADDCFAEGIQLRVETPAKTQYARLWEQINGAGSWAANPWVWVVEFRRIEA